MSDKVFIYWDNSNIYISAREAAAEREGDGAYERARVHFRNMLKLAHADRPIGKAYAIGSVPPELRHVWNRLEGEGVEVELLERGQDSGREQGVDSTMQTRMLRDAMDYNGDPGVAVLLTGDGKGFYDGIGFHADIERMHRKGWRIEVLSWRHSCNVRMRKWAEDNGLFVALDDFYDSVTFLERPAPGRHIAEPRYAADIDMARRKMLK
ncbi:MAG: NYN domain-containing protein [Gammaproteobacteria bacterium]